MLARYWKKIGLFILIVACIFNIMNKFVHKLSLNDELEASATYVNQQQNNEEENKNLALTIQKILNTNLNTDREIKKIPNETYMYDKLTIPGVLIECGFLSNPEEKNKLTTEEYQQKLASLIKDAIIEYFN